MTNDDYINKFNKYFDSEMDINAPITRAEIASVFTELFAKEYVQDSVLFTDIRERWYGEYIDSVVKKDIMRGYPDGTFRPYDVITRAEISAVIARTAEYENETALIFPDIYSGHWATEYISKVVANGIFKGDTGGTFRPNDGITRHEVVIVINRLKGFDV